jgi:hypothetical protein
LAAQGHRAGQCLLEGQTPHTEKSLRLLGGTLIIIIIINNNNNNGFMIYFKMSILKLNVTRAVIPSERIK